MIIKFNIFESKYYEDYYKLYDIHIGDFVQIKTNNSYSSFFHPEEMRNMVNNTIGKIKDLQGIDQGIVVEYEKRKITLTFSPKEIIAIGKSKEEVLAKIEAKKYNL